MKTINTDKLLETKIRIDSPLILKKLKSYYEKHGKSFRSKNELYCYLISQGLFASEKADEDANYYYLQSQTLEEKINNLLNATSIINQNLREIDKNNFIDLQENKIIATRIYNAIFNAHQALSKEYYDVGMYDDMPEDFKDMSQMYKDLYDSYGRFKFVENKKNDSIKE